MRTVDDFAQIRQLHGNNSSICAIARQLGCGRDTVRKELANPFVCKNCCPREKAGRGRG
jgi:hypothetical protein